MEFLKNKTMYTVSQIVFIWAILFSAFNALAQQSGPGIDTLTGRVYSPKKFTDSTFAGTHLVNFHTTQMHKKGMVEMHIQHRFGELKSGQENLWGIDGPANIRIGLDYSLSDNLAVGLGRSSSKKLVDAFVKYRFLRQKNQGTLISMAWISSFNLLTDKDPNKGLSSAKYPYNSSRIVYMGQLLIARKFSQRFSLQVAPTVIHYNLVEKLSDKNDMLMVPVSARFKFTKWLAITCEYGIRTFRYQRDQTAFHNSASLGFDMETGGHVFQIFCTNSFGINEVQALPYSTGNWEKGIVRIGFNVTRVF